MQSSLLLVLLLLLSLAPLPVPARPPEIYLQLFRNNFVDTLDLEELRSDYLTNTFNPYVTYYLAMNSPSPAREEFLYEVKMIISEA